MIELIIYMKTYFEPPLASILRTTLFAPVAKTFAIAFTKAVPTNPESGIKQ